MEAFKGQVVKLEVPHTASVRVSQQVFCMMLSLDMREWYVVDVVYVYITCFYIKFGLWFVFLTNRLTFSELCFCKIVGVWL